MYRIHFEPKGAFWCIQFLRFSFFGMNFWNTVVHQNGLKKEIKKFDNHEEVEKYIAEQGIDKLYNVFTQEYYMHHGYTQQEPQDPVTLLKAVQTTNDQMVQEISKIASELRNTHAILNFQSSEGIANQKVN